MTDGSGAAREREPTASEASETTADASTDSAPTTDGASTTDGAADASGAQTTDGTADADTMADVDHTHPRNGRPFGAAFMRGPSVAADGGDPDDGPTVATSVPETEPMAELDHDAGSGVEEAFQRGGEGPTDPV